MARLYNAAEASITAYATSIKARDSDLKKVIRSLKSLKPARRSTKLIKSLYDDAEALNLPMLHFIHKAGLKTSTHEHWSKDKSDSRSLSIWGNMLKELGIPVPKPGQTTWSVLGPDANQTMLNYGYRQQAIDSIWKHRDSKFVEAYKAVYYAIKKHKKKKR